MGTVQAPTEPRPQAAVSRKTRIVFAFIAVASYGVAQAPAPTRSVWDGVFTADQAKRGQDRYTAECASCHGSSLSGGESAPPLAGGEFLSNWNGLTVGDLFERVRKTMPVGKAGKLSREVNADIVAYILGFNEFPAGEKELARATEVLQDIRIEAAKAR